MDSQTEVTSAKYNQPETEGLNNNKKKNPCKAFSGPDGFTGSPRNLHQTKQLEFKFLSANHSILHKGGTF
jgi:hypothetical protein